MKGGKYRPPDQVFQSQIRKEKKREYSMVVRILRYISVLTSVDFSSSFVNWQIQFIGIPLLYDFNVYHKKETTQECLA